MMKNYDVIVIGAGPAGLAAAISAEKNGASVLLIEREAKLGGILKQCIHDGFGLTRFNEKLSGPEYAYREISKIKNTKIDITTLTFVTKIERQGGVFILTLVTRKGIEKLYGSRIILATGCRERTPRQIFIGGTNPAGLMTAGSAQYYINVLGKMPTKKCVILGSGDIGLIMARRITLEGGKVLGVYEVKPTPSGLTRNIVQCLDDFDIPLHLSHTVTKVFGNDRLEAVEIAKVDDKMHPIESTKHIVDCDALIISVGLIPENEIAEQLGVTLNSKTKGPFVDQKLMTLVDNVYSCGNSLHVSDLADYVSESGEIAGAFAANKEGNKRILREIEIDSHLMYIVPSHFDFNSSARQVIAYFRSIENYEKATVYVRLDQQVIFKKYYQHLKPPEMERITFEIPPATTYGNIKVSIEVKP